MIESFFGSFYTRLIIAFELKLNKSMGEKYLKNIL